MLRYIAEEDLPHHMTLVYRTATESTVFLDELQELERERDSIRLVLRMTEDPGWDGETRRIGADFLRDHLRDGLESFTYFIAGPPAVVNVMAELLLGRSSRRPRRTQPHQRRLNRFCRYRMTRETPTEGRQPSTNGRA
jgi:NAD(P)H-flavin reductase